MMREIKEKVFFLFFFYTSNILHINETFACNIFYIFIMNLNPKGCFKANNLLYNNLHDAFYTIKHNFMD